jgi:putative endonuclease
MMANAKPPLLERVVAFHRGIMAERSAAALLESQGFKIVARRWKTKVGEVDLVARRPGLLVFVEVKARARLDWAAESVSERQRGRIIAAAEAWLAAHPDDLNGDIRFDAVLVSRSGAPPQHIPAAFDASF